MAKVDDALILAFLEQCFEHDAGFRAVLRVDVRVRALSARSRRAVKYNMTDEVNGSSPSARPAP